ncbi:MAG: ATP-binding protein, partial [Actinomycetota bacterium]|nr:ATP-binding protein [Actinomycetota bacterium]
MREPLVVVTAAAMAQDGTMPPGTSSAQPVGRGTALSTFDSARRVLLYGPLGIGKTTIARALAGRRAVWISPQSYDVDAPYSGVAEFAAAVSDDDARAALAADSVNDARLRGIVTESVRRMSTALVIDNAQWLDAHSTGV